MPRLAHRRVREMPSRKQEMQDIIRMYREKTGEGSVIMKDVAEYAIKQGWPLPKP